MKYLVKIGEQTFKLNVDETTGLIANENQQHFEYDLVELKKGSYSLIFDGKSYLFYLEKVNGQYKLFVEGEVIDATVQDEQNVLLEKFVKAHKSEPKEQLIKAPIPGLITKVFVQSGYQLKKDETILTLEAMKMENLIKAPCACVVEKVFVKAGQTVQQNQELVLLKRET